MNVKIFKKILNDKLRQRSSLRDILCFRWSAEIPWQRIEFIEIENTHIASTVTHPHTAIAKGTTVKRQSEIQSVDVRNIADYTTGYCL